MELRIEEVQLPEKISFNFEEIKEAVSEKVAYYKDLVYTDEQIKTAKADRATLNKFVAALESKRKEIKKQCLAPYEAFEKQMKEIVAIVNEPISMIDAQVKGYEEQQRTEKLEKIREYWYALLESDSVPEGITFNQIFIEKWLNASVKMSVVEAEMKIKLEQIAADLTTLENLPEFSFEAKEVYKDTLDINRAIAEGKRLSEIQKRKAEAEAAAQRATVNATPAVVEQPTVQPTEQQREWVAFQALMTPEEAKALGQYMRSHGIRYKAVN